MCAIVTDRGAQTGRQFANALILPDASILVIGGGTGLPFNPPTPTPPDYTLQTAVYRQGLGWQVVGPSGDSPTRRIYHSTDASESTVHGHPLPLLLDELGLPGCSLMVPPSLSQIESTGVVGFERGYAGIDVPFRIDPTGRAAAFQWLVFDPLTLAYGASPRCEVHVR